MALEGWKVPTITFLGIVDTSLKLRDDAGSVRSGAQLRAMGFVKIPQAVPLVDKNGKSTSPRPIVNSWILVVVPIRLPRYKRWLPQRYEKSSDFLIDGKMLMGVGAMIGFLDKSLINTTESTTTLPSQAEVPIVIMNEVHMLNASSDRGGAAASATNPPSTPQRSRSDLLLGRKRKQHQAAIAQVEPGLPSSQVSGDVQSSPTRPQSGKSPFNIPLDIANLLFNREA
jgi:hypothetical protein